MDTEEVIKLEHFLDDNGETEKSSSELNVKEDMDVSAGSVTEIKPYSCDVGGKRFKQEETLSSHIKPNTDQTTVVCSEFLEEIFGKDSLNIDNLKQKLEIGKKKLKAKKRYKLTNHMLSHTGEKPRPYKCNTCNEAFSLKGTLQRHILATHMEDKPFSCSTCGKCFSLERTLKAHMVIHTGIKAYNCPTCGQSFAHYSSLRNHIRLHTGEKPFICSTCGKTFRQQSSLSKHLVVHTSEKPHLCSLCGKGYKRNNHLMKHKQSMHKEALYGTEYEIKPKIPKNDSIIDKLNIPLDSADE